MNDEQEDEKSDEDKTTQLQLEAEKQTAKKQEEEKLVEESIVKAKADTLKRLAEEEETQNCWRAQALTELQEQREHAARAASQKTGATTSSREPSSSMKKFYKPASMVHNTPDVEIRVLKRERVVPQIGSAPDLDDEPPPPTPSHSCEACI
ncbi:hypothetical protein J3R30DRAFT_3822378 [Lentinula aciculospora]|uniref:Uncharacterized protein n=1 Tax=Lentinula aciculospora TaxID=153920 RepID=A0A9W8ZZ37_9AGAR|nr:hypothetical protein J3R30DRAFT_3822378 [Lentinula aciculospora]